MRIMGKSPVDKCKYIVEITEEELKWFNDFIDNQLTNKSKVVNRVNSPPHKPINKKPSKPITQEDLDILEDKGLDIDGFMRDMGMGPDGFDECFDPDVFQKVNETSEIATTTDDILDNYNAKKINKQQMTEAINAIQRK